MCWKRFPCLIEKMLSKKPLKMIKQKPNNFPKKVVNLSNNLNKENFCHSPFHMCMNNNKQNDVIMQYSQQFKKKNFWNFFIFCFVNLNLFLINFKLAKLVEIISLNKCMIRQQIPHNSSHLSSIFNYFFSFIFFADFVLNLKYAEMICFNGAIKLSFICNSLCGSV